MYSRDSNRESDAWPADPQDAYGLEKIVTEELLKHYQEVSDRTSSVRLMA